MRPYSKDLRRKVVERYEKNEGSLRYIAHIFNVSLGFVFNLIKGFRETGSIDPKPHGGGYPPKIDGQGLEVVKQLVEKTPDATLDEFCKSYEEQCNIKVSSATMSRAISKLNMTRKKNFSPSQKRHRRSKSTA